MRSGLRERDSPFVILGPGCTAVVQFTKAVSWHASKWDALAPQALGRPLLRMTAPQKKEAPIPLFWLALRWHSWPRQLCGHCREPGQTRLLLVDTCHAGSSFGLTAPCKLAKWESEQQNLRERTASGGSSPRILTTL